MNILETQSGETHFQFQIGPLLIKILFLRYKPPEPDWYEKPHAHSTYELHFIERGNGTLKSGGKEYALRPGTFYLTGPEIYHEQLTDPHNPMSEYAVNFDIRRCKGKTDEGIPKKESRRIGEALEKTKFLVWNRRISQSGYFWNDLCRTGGAKGRLLFYSKNLSVSNYRQRGPLLHAKP